MFTQGVVFVGLNNDELTRFGVIVPKKVGNAVVRHRVARMVRHSWMPVLLKHPHGLEIVVRADAGADSLSVADWTSQVEAAVAKQ